VIELLRLPFEYERGAGAIVRVDQDAALSAFGYWTGVRSRHRK
jgi:hypothetical protein